jgi:c-di-GMP-binding flagellar brake protein YcgR
MSNERREYPRKEISQPVHVRFRYPRNWRKEMVEIEGDTKNISLGGMHLVMHDIELLEEQIPPDAFTIKDINFTITFPEKEVETAASGALLWHKFVEKEKRKFFLSLGINLSEMDEIERKKLGHLLDKACPPALPPPPFDPLCCFLLRPRRAIYSN